ncbi:MAG: carboxylesterase family protein [Lachnospiraceae bacterium]|nr:carboxylesterase family protein [Candidatus Merdinaster equi]
MYSEIKQLTSGQIRGCTDEKNGVSVYKGIPYGEAPVGKLRLKPTVKVKHWDGVKDCTEFGPNAIQEKQAPFMFWTEEFIASSDAYSEDCLTLNVWVKEDGETNKPVILYFHGGRFVSGSSSCEVYDGTSFARKGVVFVSFNHRVGTLAQLSTREIYEVSGNTNSGNYNLFDALTVMEWIRDNIAKFGGDASNVTLMGQSSGAGEVNALTVCEKAKGLYKRAIALSYNSYAGTIAENGWKELEDAFVQGADVTDGKALDEILEAPSEYFLEKAPIDTMRVDGNLLTNQFNKLVDAGLNKDTEVVFGAVPGDWLICSPFYHKNTEKKEDVIQYLKDFFGEYYDEAENIYDIENTDKAVLIPRINNDYIISCMLLYVKARNQAGAKNTYVYYFKHVMPGPENGAYGVFHSSELPYFFNYFTDKRKDFWKADDTALGEKLNQLMVDYAKGEALEKHGWNPTKETNYLEITGEGFVEQTFDEKLFALYEKCFRR